MWFSPIKGVYPGLAQIDRTLPVGADETDIVRGSIVYVDENGGDPVFRLADVAQASDAEADLHIVLVGQDDFQAGMAGSIGQGQSPDTLYADNPSRAVITALSFHMPMEFQTDEWETTGYDGNYNVGTLLTVGAGGKLTPREDTTEVTLAQVTKFPFVRWVNNAVAIPGRRTGANVTVLQARTMYVAPVEA